MANQAALFLVNGDGIADPFRANRIFMARNNGPAGSEPTVSDEGGVTWSNGYPGRSIISNAWSYFSSSLGYGVSRYFFGNGWVCNPGVGHINTPFRIVGQATSDWSMMLRGNFYKDANNIIRQVGINSTADFGPNSLQLQVSSPYTGTGRTFQVTVAGTGSGGGTTITSGVHPLGQNTELLITKKYNFATGQATYRLFVNGALEGSATVAQADSADINNLRVSMASTMFTSGGLDGSMEFYLSDDIFWNTCVTTAAYTVASQPFE